MFEMLRQIEPRTACWEHSVTEKTQTAFKISNGSLRVAPEPTYRQAPAPSAVALGAGSVANQANTVSVGSVGNERRITNVAAGISSTDAVNVSQLSNLASGVQSQFNGVQNQFNGIQNQFNGLQNQVNGIQNQVTDNWREARGGVALALAAGGLRFDNRPGKWSVAGAYGNFKGMSGLAFGLGYAVTDRLRFNATVSGAPELGSMGGVVSGSFTLN